MSERSDRWPSPRARALLDGVLAALDWDALGRIYCDEGGEAFWQDRRLPLVELGRRWAAEVLRRVPAGGRSLYVGAGVAELPALIAEVVDRSRRCSAHSLRAAEVELVNAALAAAGAPDELRLSAGDAGSARGPFDHLSVVSVLDDPETFPQVSAVTYGRASPWTLDIAAFDAERRRVRALVAAVLDRLRWPALVTTTFEEAGWLLEGAEALGVRARGEDAVVETALVGDPIGFLWLGERQ